MKIFNSEVLTDVGPGEVIIFPCTIEALNKTPMWCVAATFMIEAVEPFIKEETCDDYNVCGLFPCAGMAIGYARVLEARTLGKWDENEVKVEHGDTVH